jgi:HEAT repeat protein
MSLHRLLKTSSAALGAALLLTQGCGGSGGTPCAVWTEKLANSGEIEKALDNTGKLKCVEALPVLKQLFDDGLLQESVLETAKEIDHPNEAAPLVRAALLKPKTARVAASMARDWKLAAAVPELAKVLSDETLWEAREPAIEALLELDSGDKHEDVLIGLVLADPNREGVEVHRRAIVELGRIGSKKAVPALVKALFLRSTKGQEVFVVARHALAQIGDPSVVDQLLGVLDGSNKDVLDFAKSQGLAPFEVTGTPKVVQVLADSLDPRILDPLIADLAADIVPPDTDDQTFARWADDKGNRLKLIGFASGHLGAEPAIASLGAVFKDASKDAVRQRITAARALAMIGTEAAQDMLIKVWRDDLIVEVLRAGTLQILALAIDDRRLAQWDELLGIGGKKKKVELHEEVRKILAEDELVLAYIGVVRECKADMACYIAKTKSENQSEQVKALAVLGRGRFGAPQEVQPVKDALLAAFEAAPKAMIDTKRYALIGLTRLGNQADGELLVKKGLGLIEAQDNYWGEELFAYGQGMKRRMLR